MKELFILFELLLIKSWLSLKDENLEENEKLFWLFNSFELSKFEVVNLSEKEEDINPM